MRKTNKPGVRWHSAIVLQAREAHLAGATVMRGPMGFGKSSRLHTAKILRLSEDLPLVIEIVDSEEKINSFLPVLDKMIGGGLGSKPAPLVSTRMSPSTSSGHNAASPTDHIGRAVRRCEADLRGHREVSHA